MQALSKINHHCCFDMVNIFRNMRFNEPLNDLEPTLSSHGEKMVTFSRKLLLAHNCR
jgi:hypothetical protein